MTQVSTEILVRNGYAPEDISPYIQHQANLRIIQSAVERLKLRPEQVAINIDRYANTTAATIPISLTEVYQQGRLKKGDLLLLASFGAGFTWGSVLIRWAT
jgi:3-oxoacyl-[acyl-carrier-protein] synthase-3